MELGILPSRQELLSRIELACELDNSFISVVGNKGSGKSALLEYFIEHHGTNSQKCFVSGAANMPAFAVRERILAQLVANCTYDSQLSLAQNLAILAPEQVFSVFIILDDAHFIDDAVFYDLIELLDQQPHQISVIYAQKRDELRQADFNSRQVLIEFHLEALDQRESRLLLSYYHGDKLPADQSILQAVIDRAEGNPAKLAQWNQSVSNSQSPVTINALSQLNVTNQPVSVEKQVKTSYAKLLVIMLGGLVITLVTISIWYFMPPSQLELKQQLRQKVEQQLLSVPQSKITDTPPSNHQEFLEDLLVSQWQNTEKDSNLIDDQQTTPQKKNPTEEFSFIEVIQRKSPSEIDDAVTMDKLTQDKLTQDKLTQNKDTQDKVSVGQPKPAAPVVDGSSSSESMQEVVNQPIEQSQLYDNQWFLEQKPNGAMIQLVGVSDLKVLNAYLQRHQNIGPMRVYQTMRAQKFWYVVTIGPHPDLAAARAAIKQLPAQLQATKPWVKSLKVIQKEIAQIK